MILLFHGPDAFSRAEEIAKLKQDTDPALADLSTTTLDGRQISVADLILACNTLPFLSRQHFVIVEGMAARQGKDFWEEVVEYLPKVPETTTLIFSEDEPVDSKHPLFKLILAQGRERIRHFSMLKGGELERWIAGRARRKGAHIEPRAVQELALSTGGELRLLDIELEKLATYAGEAKAITLDDVRLLVSDVREESIFALVDALGERNGRMAIHLLHQLLDDSRDSGQALYILSMMARQFRLLLQVKELAGQRASVNDIMRALRLNHSFIAEKLLGQARNYSLERLREIYARLQALDVTLKTGGMDTLLALDLFVAEVCQQ